MGLFLRWFSSNNPTCRYRLRLGIPSERVAATRLADVSFSSAAKPLVVLFSCPVVRFQGTSSTVRFVPLVSIEESCVPSRRRAGPSLRTFLATCLNARPFLEETHAGCVFFQNMRGRSLMSCGL